MEVAMKRRLITCVLVLFSMWIGFTNAAHDKFTLSSDYDKPLDEHIDWCMDYKVTTEAVAKELTIPNNLDKYLNRMTTYFIPNGIVPQQQLGLSIEDLNHNSNFERNEIDAFINNIENVKAVEAWLTGLREGLEAAYAPDPIPRLRFRFYNEINTFETFTPVDYFYILKWFKAKFDQYGPRDATLVISLAGAENSGGRLDYLRFLKTFLEQCPTSGELPFDGMDLHGYNMSYQYWSEMYQQVRTTFVEVFGPTQGMTYFNRMQFWALETTGIHRGACSTAWSSCIFEYNSDWDAARHVIKTVSHALNIPNMQFITIFKNRGEWNKRRVDGLFNMGGLYDHGCAIFDTGRGTKTYAADPVHRFTNFMWLYYPDTPSNHVFSTANLRNYRFRTDDGKYRVVVWRDHGNEPMEDATVYVPFGQYNFVLAVDLITNRVSMKTVHQNLTGPYITLDVDSNPILITPNLSIEELPHDETGVLIRSAVSDVTGFTPGNWQSLIHLVNPDSTSCFVEITPFLNDGTIHGTPYEFTLPSRGSIHLDFADIYDPFEGYVTISSSIKLNGFIEHRLRSASEIQGCFSPIIATRSDDPALAPTRFLTADWEVSDAMMNVVTLLNSGSDPVTASYTVYDESGAYMDFLTETLSPGSQFSTTIIEDPQTYRYGMVEIDTGNSTLGQITRFSDAPECRVWTETPLHESSEMITEIELKASTIPDADLYSRVIVTNPWPDTVTGTVFERDETGTIINQYPVSLGPHETLELVLSSSSVDSLAFKMDNDIRVFGRREDEISHGEGESEIAGLTKSVKESLVMPGSLIIPYFTYVSSTEDPQFTMLRFHNENTTASKITVSIYDTSGNCVSQTPVDINPESILKIHISELLPPDILNLQGSVILDIPQIGGISAFADYTVYETGYEKPMVISGSFQEMR